mgnify:CR=1 FL=1
MAIKRVWIEEDCIACGTCEGICPEVFTVTDRSRVNEGVNFDDFEAGIKELPKAARSRLSNTNRRKHINPYFSFLDKITESLRDL